MYYPFNNRKLLIQRSTCACILFWSVGHFQLSFELNVSLSEMTKNGAEFVINFVFSLCRYGATRAIVIAMTCTFFEFFNIPVFWPILVMYFIVLFVITMKRQIKVRNPVACQNDMLLWIKFILQPKLKY